MGQQESLPITPASYKKGYNDGVSDALEKKTMHADDNIRPVSPSRAALRSPNKSKVRAKSPTKNMTTSRSSPTRASPTKTGSRSPTKSKK